MPRVVTVPPDHGTVRAPNPDAASLDDVERDLVGIFADLSAALGLPRSYGQIYGLAYASPTPICFDDVVSRLGLSKGSASQGIRVLRELGALRLASEDGRRKTENWARVSSGDAKPSSVIGSPSSATTVRHYLLPEVSVRALLGAIMRQRIQPPLESGGERLARLKAALPSDRRTVRAYNGGSGRGKHRPAETPSNGPTDVRTAHLRQRIHSLETWHKKAKAFLPFLLKLAG